MGAPVVRAQGAATGGQIAAWGALLAVVLLLSLRGWGSLQVGLRQDDAHYVVLARSIATGQRYGLINAPDPPIAVKYPFGFPLLLAPVVGLFPHELLAPTVVSLAATLINVSLLVWGWPWLSPTTSRWWGLAVAGLYGLSPMVIGQTRAVLSEPAFTAFVLAALILTEACVDRARSNAWLSVALGVVLLLALFTRLLGAALWVAVFGRIVLARGRRGVGLLAGVVAGSLGALALVLTLTTVELRQLAPRSYMAELEGTRLQATAQPADRGPHRWAQVVAGYALDDLRRVLVAVGGGEREHALAERIGLGALPNAIGAAVAVLVAVGAWRAVRLRALSPSALLFELSYAGAISIWPLHTARYLYPIQPLLALQLLLGLAALAVVAGRRWRVSGPQGARWPRLAAAGAWAALVVLAVWKSWAIENSHLFARDLRVGASWLAANSPTAAIVMTRYPPSVYLYAERRTIDIPRVQSAAELERVVDAQHVDYVLLGPALQWRPDGVLAYDEHTQHVVLPALAELASEGRVALVYESSPRELVRVYRVEPRRNPTGAGSAPPRLSDQGS